jgi:hypothetical protein
VGGDGQTRYKKAAEKQDANLISFHHFLPFDPIYFLKGGKNLEIRMNGYSFIAF